MKPHMMDSLLNAYRVLRTTNPSPYMVFMKTDDVQIISTSPETLVRLQDGRLATFPVAGSRPRGTTKQEDDALERELLQDEKELSEHNMLVDLARNDIGKISEYGSVNVIEYKLIHRYSKIMHIASVVEGLDQTKLRRLHGHRGNPSRRKPFQGHPKFAPVKLLRNSNLSRGASMAAHLAIWTFPAIWTLALP